jgi:hypothetical protein
MSESDSTSQADAPLEIEINNDVEKDYTLIKVGKEGWWCSASTDFALHSFYVGRTFLTNSDLRCLDLACLLPAYALAFRCNYLPLQSPAPFLCGQLSLCRQTYCCSSTLSCAQVGGRGQGDPLLAALGSSLVQIGS